MLTRERDREEEEEEEGGGGGGKEIEGILQEVEKERANRRKEGKRKKRGKH
jgi:hypothetical protein